MPLSGHVEKRYKGSWTIVIEVGQDPATGKRKRITRNIKCSRKKDAEEEMRRIMAEIERGTYVEPSKMTLGEYLEKWLASHSANLAPSTKASYEMIVKKHLIPALGNVPLSQLQPLHLQNYYGAVLDAGYSNRTVRYHHTVLKRALKQAVKWRMMPLNPADAVDPPKQKRPQVKALNADEVVRLLEAAEGHRDYALIFTALYTGLRRGELAALRWSDVDLEAGKITVRQSMIRIKGEFVFREPKTQKSRRQLPLPKEAVRVLKSHRKEQLETKLRMGEQYKSNDLVFCNKDGTPLDPGQISHRFQALVAKAGFPGLRFHDLRHTYATLLLAQGVHPKVVQELLGHETISTTLDTYSHVIPSLAEAAVSKLDALLSNSGNDSATVQKK